MHLDEPLDAASVPLDELYGALSSTIRRVSVFGPHRSGKTSWFASLYGIAADHSVAIRFDGSSTLEYLKQLWGEYKTGRGGFPSGTGKSIPTRISFTLREKQVRREWRMTMIDYAGELVHESPPGDKLGFLRERVDRWMKQAEAILVFLDVFGGQPEDILTRRDEVFRLLELCRDPGEKGRINKPLGLVITKWDCLGPISEIHDEDETKRCEAYTHEARRARDYLAKTPTFRRIHDLLETYASSYELFPVSSVGFNRQAMTFPTQPFNILRPLLWAAEQADLGRLEAARDEATQLPARRAIRVYERFCEIPTSRPAQCRRKRRINSLKFGTISGVRAGASF